MTVIICRQTHRSAGGAEYTQTVTLKRTYIIVAASWVVILVPALCFVLDPQIIFWFEAVQVHLSK